MCVTCKPGGQVQAARELQEAEADVERLRNEIARARMVLSGAQAEYSVAAALAEESWVQLMRQCEPVGTQIPGRQTSALRYGALRVV